MTGLGALAQSQTPWSALDLSYRIGTTPLPVAAYRNISDAEFRSMISKAFQKSGFTLVKVAEQKDKTVFEFKFDVTSKSGMAPAVLVSTDKIIDGKKKCSPCFLRSTEIKNLQDVRTLPWMAQYDMVALLVPAIDNAYSTMESIGRQHLDPSIGFNYKPQWKGEKNLFADTNSFIGIGLPSLKESITRAYRNAGFVPVESATPAKEFDSVLSFRFPVDPAKEDGVVYEVGIRNQFDAEGHCYPCEVTEHYNPYQQLPPAGLSGVFSRATLESRFTAARDAAYDNMRSELERYLRPRSAFSALPKVAPLGSPPPRPIPLVVT